MQSHICPLDALGNEYDLSRLIRYEEDSPWIPMDMDAGAGRRFYINVCKPLPALKDCPGQEREKT